MNYQTTTTPKLRSENILVVDDTPDNLRLLSAILTVKGYAVRKALSGKLALNACQKNLPDLILLDINMPDMNGYEVCKKLKNWEITRDIPVIFISALDDALDKVKALEIGGIDYITKPFQEAEVLARIGNHLKLRSLQINLQEKNISLQEEIKERCKVQKDLEVSEAKNRALLDAIPDLMFRISSEGVFLDYRSAHITEQAPIIKISAAASQIEPQKDSQQAVPLENLQEPIAESSVVGKNIYQVLSDDLATWMMYYIEETLLTSTIQVGEYVQQVNGNWHAYEVRYVKSGQNEVLALLRDISDRKQAEAQRLQAEALLRNQKQQLEKALNDLKKAQTQLIQTEKMVALGQLVAGIAHEINNPVNFISGNLNYADEYFQDLINLLAAYQEEYPNPVSKIQEITKDLELNFLVKDLQNIMDAMHRGAKRIQDIVLSLRNFSRLDEAEMKSVDIHQGIDSTLSILQHQLAASEKHPAIKVIKEYAQLPKVTCYASQINQVFLHLLNNAIDALEEDSKFSVIDSMSELSSVPTIRICTEMTDSNTVLIRIIDNGPGINETTRSRLFDPFFTTKPVGSGRGLGLSISYQIVVQQHQGQLSCYSSPGQGAEFAIAIPVNQTPR